MCATGASFRNFYYLLRHAHSIFINLFFYILYFTLYYLLFVNCRLLVFFLQCVCAKKCGVCIFYCFFLFFCYRCLYHRIPLQFFIFYISRPRRYARHRMWPVIIDVTWFLCVSVGYFTFCTNFKPFLSLLWFTFLKPNLLASLSAEGGQQSVNSWQRASSPALDGKLAATTDRLAKK